MKRLIALLVVISVLAPAVACSGNTYRIGVCSRENNGDGALFHGALRKYCQNNTDADKYFFYWQDAWWDNDTQIQQVDDFIEQGFDVLIVDLVDSSSAPVITQKAAAAGIPVVFVNSYGFGAGRPSDDDINASKNICYVGVDFRQAGTLQGEIIAGLPDNGDINGDGVVSYVMITGERGGIEDRYFSEYSIKALTDAGIAVEELAKEYDYWPDAQQLAATALNKFGKKIDVIFCANDWAAIETNKAIMEAGREVGKDIYLVGIGGRMDCIQMIYDSELDTTIILDYVGYKMTGTVFNDYIGQAGAAAEAAVNYASGRKNKKFTIIDYQPVTRGWTYNGGYG